MKVKDLIKSTDYDYISWRIKLFEDGDDGEFVGCCHSRNGKLLPLDGDTIYSEDNEVIKYEEWFDPENDIYNGLTVVVKNE